MCPFCKDTAQGYSTLSCGNCKAIKLLYRGCRTLTTEEWKAEQQLASLLVRGGKQQPYTQHSFCQLRSCILLLIRKYLAGGCGMRNICELAKNVTTRTGLGQDVHPMHDYLIAACDGVNDTLNGEFDPGSG